MKNILIKLGVVFFILLLIFSISKNKLVIPKEVKKIEVENLVTIENKQGKKEIAMDDYLLGVVAGEMPVTFEIEALKAQVVAARTYVYSRDKKVDGTINTQVYLNQETRNKNWGNQTYEYEQKIKKAIEDTKAEVITYEGKLISALFFSSSNGQTTNNEDYFDGVPVGYLRSVESIEDSQVNPNFIQETIKSDKEIMQAFQIDNPTFSIDSFYENQSVKEIYIDGKLFSGRDVREKLQLPSNTFTIKKVSDGFCFTTTGYGHGVGMSQYGAQAMALQGDNYKKILKHYYQGIEIVKK